jgi:hypothetical protein
MGGSCGKSCENTQMFAFTIEYAKYVQYMEIPLNIFRELSGNDGWTARVTRNEVRNAYVILLVTPVRKPQRYIETDLKVALVCFSD